MPAPFTLTVRIPVRLAHQEEALVRCASIQYRFEALDFGVCSQRVPKVAGAVNLSVSSLGSD